jgi:hypothetical protein
VIKLAENRSDKSVIISKINDPKNPTNYIIFGIIMKCKFQDTKPKLPIKNIKNSNQKPSVDF